MGNDTLYFGYGSNLWKDQMRQCCPTSQYLGIARLKGYRWIIYERGYANIVEIAPAESEDRDKHSHADEVWGLVYRLRPEDERRLDVNEGVPDAYTKEITQVEFWPAKLDRSPDPHSDATPISSLVYIDRKRTGTAKPKKEYIQRMNMGIRDAVKEGVPQDYVEEVMRKFIPEEDNDVQ